MVSGAARSDAPRELWVDFGGLRKESALASRFPLLLCGRVMASSRLRLCYSQRHDSLGLASG